MAVERAGGRKFAQLVADHVLGAIDRDELVAVMHREGQSHHIRHHHRAPRPGADDPLVARGERGRDLAFGMAIDERTFFERPHFTFRLTLLFGLTLALGPPAYDVMVRRLLAARLVTLGRLSPRRLGMVALGAPLAAAVRMVDRIHR